MNINLIEADSVCQMVFKGSLTFGQAKKLEDGILDALRRYTRFEVDLSGVSEIDLCGLHLLRILETIAGDNARMVKGSAIVEQAKQRLLATHRRTWLRHSRKE